LVPAESGVAYFDSSFQFQVEWMSTALVSEQELLHKEEGRRAITCGLEALGKVPAESELLGRPLSRVYVLSVENKVVGTTTEMLLRTSIPVVT
jgi:hypothetical protein